MAEEKKIIRPQAGFQEKFVRSNVDFVVGGGSLGGGKEQPLSSQVLTRLGWKKMGNLKIGDLVCTPFGEPKRVLQIFEHHNKDIYELTTSDNRVCRCGLEHLWSVRSETQVYNYRKKRDISKNITTCETSQLIEWLEQKKLVYLPIPNAQEFKEKEYIIPPYILGVLLGDGCITDSAWSSTNRFMMSNTELDLINKVSRIAQATKTTIVEGRGSVYVHTPNAKKYYDYIMSVGLNVKSYDKFIPQEYLWGSIEQRKDLLNGLFDTDGTVDKKVSYSYSTTSERLCDDIIYLCRSLGYKAVKHYRIRERHTKGKEFYISIQTNDIIGTTQKHCNRILEFSKNQYKSNKFVRLNDHVRIVSIKKVSNEDTRCIWIDDPLHLYITDDFIVTHNTAGAVLMCAEPALDPNFRAVFLRNNLNDLRSGGGILDEFRKMYGNNVSVVESGDPHVDFISGARIDVTHIADQSREKVLQRFKGRQYDLIYFDEGTGFDWSCFSAVYTRNRGTAQWTGKVRMTTNPDKNHWLRKFLDWYIGIDGYIIPERDGVVRYFFMAGETVNDVVWGDSKKEVYLQCKTQIDRILAKVNGTIGHATYEDIIKSFTFYLGKMSENKATLGHNSGYIGSVAVMGGRNAQQLLEGNWNVSPNEDLDIPIPSSLANSVFMNDPQRNNDRWVTCDLADTGTDNFIALAWNGFHIEDILILGHTTPRENAERLQEFARIHDVADCHIIYDAIRGTYINDYISDAVQFVSYRQPMGMYGRGAYNLKTECYMRLVQAITKGYLSFDEKVAKRVYEHQKQVENISVQAEFIEECGVVQFKSMSSGKKALMSKKEMNSKLGKNRSMDLLDPIAMRFYPCLEFVYGEELEKTTMIDDKDDNDGYYGQNSFNVFNNNNWC